MAACGRGRSVTLGTVTYNFHHKIFGWILFRVTDSTLAWSDGAAMMARQVFLTTSDVCCIFREIRLKALGFLWFLAHFNHVPTLGVVVATWP